jgi:hypothetical protein
MLSYVALVSQIKVDCLEGMEYLLSYSISQCIKFNLDKPKILGKLVPYVQEICGPNPETSCRDWVLIMASMPQ